MIGTRQMASVVEEVKKTGAKLVLVGDEKQLQPIDAGAPFREIGELVGRVELKDIKRQRDEQDVEAIRHIVSGRSEQALQSYAQRGLLLVSETRAEAMDALIADWKKEGAIDPKSSLIVTGTRFEAAILNRKAQEERRKEGVLGEESIFIDGSEFFKNDRVMFTKRSALYRIENGSAGIIEEIDEKEGVLIVRLDDDKKVKIPYEHYEHIKLGYAATTHKFQGATAERCFVLAGGDMQDRELSYVQASRARGKTRLYVDSSEVGDLTAALARKMNKSRQKEMAISVVRESLRDEIKEEIKVERSRSVEERPIER